MSTKLTTADITERLHSGIRLIGKYLDAQTKCEFECPVGHRWFAKAITVTRGHGCRCCADEATGIARRLSQREVQARVGVFGKRLVSDYLGVSTKALFECERGHRWYAIPGNLMNGSGCPICSKHGFDPDGMSDFYVLLVTGSQSAFCGFGITRQFVKRMQEHANALRKFNMVIAHRQVVPMSGIEAMITEKFVKETFPLINTGIPGFKTEAVQFHLFEEVKGVVKAMAFTGDAFADFPVEESL